jgi:hypothetical protein
VVILVGEHARVEGPATAVLEVVLEAQVELLQQFMPESAAYSTAELWLARTLDRLIHAGYVVRHLEDDGYP